MVVLDKFPNLAVTIQMNGAEVQEYNDDEEVEVGSAPAGDHQALRTVSKYIEAIDGAEFSIKCCASRQFKIDAPNLQIDVSVDGNFSESLLFRQDHIGQPLIIKGPTTFHPASNNGPERWALRKFRFSKLDISSEESRLSSLNKDKAEAEKVGTIEVRIWRVSAATPVPPRATQQKTIACNKFHEKALKGEAKSHNVSYSGETPILAASRVEVEKIDGNGYPVAIYKFKYRSKESLKQLLIIERTPELEDSPAPDPELVVDLENLTTDQRERLQEFLLIRRITNRSSHTPERKVKRERDNGEGSSNQARRKKSKTTQFVDLTGDSDEDE
ncbi:d6c14631-513c-4e42-9fb9-7ed42fb51ab4 [Sclerotinia trifoliorum]|uniref:D6c14631-513c-4e42-9fb9-7ed42fb51ab4 n=1 Tax=Sclerotinia trifoliorum TaxID=28548 RepID=A0A8H2VPP3_9HELO|nr:d6c14631-513c-4e42-9fb9-7ed42fb51ab4 [Sclerotinia trifoliorum]